MKYFLNRSFAIKNDVTVCYEHVKDRGLLIIMKKEQQLNRLIPHFKLFIFLSLCLAIVSQLIGLIPPLIMEKIIDDLIPGGELTKVIQSIVWFILIPVMMTVMNTFYKYFLAVIARKSGRALTLQAFENILHQRMTYFDESKSGELATFVRQETMKYVMFWLADLPQMIANILVSAIVVIYVGSIHWVLAIILLVYYPLAFFPSNYFGKVVAGFTGKIIASNGKMTQIIADSVRGIRLIKSYQLEKKQVSTLKGILTQAVGIWSKVAFFDNLTNLWITSFVNQLTLGISFAVAAGLVIEGQMTIGGIVIIISYLGVFYANAAKILTTNYEFKKQLAEFEPLKDLLGLADAESSGTDEIQEISNLSFSNVSFSYTEERGQIFNDLNLNIDGGQWVGIIGESGAGKSTIFDLLLRFYEPQQGQVTLNQTPLGRYTLKSLRQKMTLVSQGITLFPGTIEDNLRLAKADATAAELEDVLRQVELDTFIQSVPEGLQTEVGEEGSQISGGQKQRLSLAQGLLRQSPILLLDEVSSALDSETSAKIKTMIKHLQEKKQLTIIAVSHDRTFLDECDAIYRIQNGQAEKVLG